MHLLGSEHIFPSADSASKEGIVAIGGDLDPNRILKAYKNGIFPWFENDDHLVWWSPDPRMVLFPEKLKVSKSTKKLLKENFFKVTFNQSFEIKTADSHHPEAWGWGIEHGDADVIHLCHLLQLVFAFMHAPVGLQ